MEAGESFLDIGRFDHNRIAGHLRDVLPRGEKLPIMISARHLESILQTIADHQGFKADRLPARADIESVPKQEAFDFLEKAGKKCKKGKYSKGIHAFKILEAIDPHKVMEGSCWARRFVETLQNAAITS
jgi:hypothetical protein